MAYSELIKNFNRTRDYMRQFFVYGFKSRDEYNTKSARSYDDERRRIESWLGEYMQFRQSAEGKNVFISIDSRLSNHNPLYKGWKAKSFTDKDITLHFILFDILHNTEVSLSINEIIDRIEEKLSAFETPMEFDESTVRKKLKEYIAQGLIVTEKQGKTMYYSRSEGTALCGTDCLDFFSEVAPCGVVGSYILDRVGNHKKHFAFKHHYITSAMDSEILYQIFDAIRQKRQITLNTINRRKETITENYVVPLKVFVSVQNGRQHLLAYAPRFDRVTSFRIDRVDSVALGDVREDFDNLRAALTNMQRHMWGVSTQGRSNERIEHIEFTVTYGDNEQHIHNRLLREKRCGTVERIDNNTSRFSADIYDSTEVIPWIRTFICRITDISFSNKDVEKQFKDDISAMYQLYGLEGGDQ